jgi:hypothetical protein
MEDLHVKHLSDAEMKELNMITRQALYDILSTIEDKSDPQRLVSLNHLAGMVPDYWEIPADDNPIIEHPDYDRHMQTDDPLWCLFGFQRGFTVASRSQFGRPA